MKRFTFVLVVIALFISVPAFAQVKPCEELKNEIAAKLEAKGVVNYTLKIVPTDQVENQNVVGSCNGGKNKITYSREKPPSGN